LSLLLWTQRLTLASFYTQSDEVAVLAAALFAWLVLYHVADAIQVFCVFALRCYGITLLPLVSYTLLLWGVGLAGGYAVAYAWPEGVSTLSWLTPQSPLAFWQTSSLALCLTAALMLAVLWRVAYRQRHHTPQV
jgi:MATE family multidrug resistance protein